MKHSRIVYLPAALVAAAGAVLLLYAALGIGHPAPPPFQGTAHRAGELRHFGPRGENGGQETFKTLGTIAVFCAAGSYAWLRLKKKRRSGSAVVRRLVRVFDKLHPYAGYAAILLIAVHAAYFLIQAEVKRETYTGIAAFALLLTLGVYGFLIRRLPNKHIRKIHFLLATAFGAAAIVHAGGSAIVAALCVAGTWCGAWLLERMAKPKSKPSVPA